METGFDVRTKDPLREKELGQLNGVKFGREEEKFYLDNVKVKKCLCQKNTLQKCGDCPRQLFVSGKIDQVWLEAKRKKEQKIIQQIEAAEKNEIDKENQFNQVNINSVVFDKAPNNNIDTSNDDHDKDFTCPVFTSSSKLTDTPHRTRSSISPNVSNSKSPPSFPKLKIRSGRATLNPKVIVAAVHVSSKYEISFSSVIKVNIFYLNLKHHLIFIVL